MQLENNLLINQEDENILDLIIKGRTNIGRLKILTHYELMDTAVRFHNITPKFREFMANSIGEFEYKIFDGSIDKDGDMSNFKFRLKNDLTVLNEINILKYTDANIPKELRNIYKIQDEYIYLIRFFEVIKYEVSEEETEAIIDAGGLIIVEDEKYLHLIKNYKKSVQKFWTEDPFKAIFKLKNMGFYLGTNDPNSEENILMLEEYANDDEIVMLARNDINIDNVISSNMANIERIKIPFRLTDYIKKMYVKRDKYVPRQPSVQKLYGTGSKIIPEELKADIITHEAKLPRRLPNR